VAPDSSQIVVAPEGNTAFVLGATGIVAPIDLATNTADAEIQLGAASVNEVEDIATAPGD
jgi:hypothetical protein